MYRLLFLGVDSGGVKRCVERVKRRFLFCFLGQGIPENICRLRKGATRGETECV